MRFDKYTLLLVGLVVFFVVSRFLGFDQIYHQDEYRWASIANPFFGNLESPHPPLSEFAYKFAGRIFGLDYLRIVPFLFSFFNLILIYIISLKATQSKGVALIAAGLFTVNIYSLIANLQIDIDGAFLPFFILLAYYSFLHISEKGRREKRWFVLFGLAIIGGFLTKLSFLLFIGALIVDQAIKFYGSKDGGGLRKTVHKLWPWLAVLLAVFAAFYYFYATRMEMVVEYAGHFKSFNFGSRAYFDLVFKIFKSLVWLSPFLLLPVLCGVFMRDVLRRYRIWFIYLFINLIFYLILFDFATLTIERYFMFWIVPSVLISAQVITDLLKKQAISRNIYIVVAAAFILISYFILSLPHDVLPLNPKTAYLDRVKSLDLSFLIPFTGGSGPSGFYFSAIFIILTWLISVVSLAGALFVKNRRSLFLAAFIVFGVVYNILFSAEYLSGPLNGSVDKVAKETIQYVNSSNSVKEVITYYDIGAYYLKLNGKYNARFYTAPTRDYSERINAYQGQYMIVDFPAIDKNGRYWPVISKCPLLKKFQDKKIESYIFDCSRI
ncbi:MAG: hypothetical protein A3B91_03140 [Candidatus Yanofskybacteria bacterium RIFCSPHIGHO2_02_FULL_41_29]|nr:MAG: hypothetical protein A3B91_03140 [Candidatus Yanofskybacteria bacterium RIFCSPHIGHO2_02_FULL_41_29]OGN18107.1 MAG: hypothetical protein A3F48_02155 [Candidatus Yanofskybacteria bacterium RIFCSPHIGHO2_12_FULL_41_9]OGN23841.1 MAG: hypothetical protein A2916_04530 [Candidatus Yanofskybacteria bacterium RIFCSPLOWO2_01_FULL_41_67]OGN30458.1 MAG: hypothetical protein A3H54_00310 [Candidatus Yanofskybacteria bacterium RIFCSPLOWO2_02_FULL_41_13]OGN33058.1 MAG: hypothetical protein A3F98_02910 [